MEREIRDGLSMHCTVHEISLTAQRNALLKCKARWLAGGREGEEKVEGSIHLHGLIQLIDSLLTPPGWEVLLGANEKDC